MSQRRSAPRSPIPRYTPPASPFLSHQTITFLASWRGQLLVCTVVLVLGAIYFFLRPPIDQWHRKRKEALSRRRELELMKMSEKEDSTEEKDDASPKVATLRDKSKEKTKKEGRRRINSHLRPPTDSTTGNSVEDSISPTIASRPSTSPTKSKRTLSDHHTNSTPPSSAKLQKATNAAKTQSQSIATPTRNRPPPPIIVPKACPSITSKPIDPWNIPLPPSPLAGPSRLAPAPVVGSGVEDVSDDASISAEGEGSVKEDEDKPKNKKSEGFSIYPEDGYLSQLMNSSKKKKKKNVKSGTASADQRALKGVSNEASLPGKNGSVVDEVFEINGDGSERLPNGGAIQRHRHTRTSSIALLPHLNVTQLREIVEQRDETIDQLRAEIGMAKAEESKAKEDAVRARMGEERIRGDMERSKRGRSESIGQGHLGGRREAELQSRLAQMQQLYSTALNRLSTCENALRDSGIMLPPLPSPIPMHMPHSPLPPMPNSPYVSSAGRNTPIMGGFIPYPSPGMYPSPMLHPNPHYPHNHHSPNPYRRTSSFTNGHSPVPVLSPGIIIGNGNGNGVEEINGLYPMDIGSSTMPIGLGHPVSNGEFDEDRERRRQSIQSSVLKRKFPQMTTVEDSANLHENNQGNANDSTGTSESAQDDESISNQSAIDSNTGIHSGSASPKSRSSIGNGHVNVVLDSERGNLYYNSENIDSLISNEHNQVEEEPEDVVEERENTNHTSTFQPIFASLSHTPEQIEELRKINNVRERGRSVSSLSSAGRGMGAGLGNGGLLTPSPSKSPIPLRG
ncbi:uncharacterized protein I206_101268 [Kwoniella pini CBS 10737]|uniref:Uncharacterized protein n=1 Tax=Kwoniella pini CBS 10737 TaxID=1296096 RepID=A0A1B9IAW5_9TREE|nr:uncharacterized protein I206_00054 [Kwoniella pini CBS 10737]OCF52758.1 hypothetical protein I206_00054 [Kwoniella pini CBS 10737]